jgi:hypothetical protein
MKLEAGVTEHTVHKEDFGGRAYIGTGKIYSPEGRKIVQLYTLAHECGHIFLHNSGPGYAFPGHVKEFEAESYAHQAFREHGMTVPRTLSKWGRQYVGSWIAKDRAANVPIDPAPWPTRRDGGLLTNLCVWSPRHGRSSAQMNFPECQPLPRDGRGHRDSSTACGEALPIACFSGAYGMSVSGARFGQRFLGLRAEVARQILTAPYTSGVRPIDHPPR